MYRAPAVTLAILWMALSAAAVADDAKTYPVGRGGKLFGHPDVDELLSRPYEDHVPMACVGECLWAAHPAGWAFEGGVHYYLIGAERIGFDVGVDDGSQRVAPYSATFYPSHVAMKGGEGPLDVVGAKWITADDVLAVRLAVTNRGEDERRVWLRLTIPTEPVAFDGDRFSWTIPQLYGQVLLTGLAPGFALEGEAPLKPPGCCVEGESPVGQRGSDGPDTKRAASGGAVLGSNFGGDEGDFAEWRIDVKTPVEDAVLAIRYARADEGDAEYKVTVPTLGFVERYGFKGTAGWGGAPDDFAVAVLRLGDVVPGTHAVRVVAVANGCNVNFDALCIQAAGGDFPVAGAGTTALGRELTVGPQQTQHVGVYLAAGTRPEKAEAALRRVSALSDPLKDQVDRYKAWLLDNVPGFIADEAMTKQYWHRATSVVRKNLFRVGEGRMKRWGVAEGRSTSGWFANMISYGAGHQVRETRWLRDPVYARDILSTWCNNAKENGVFPNFIRPDAIGDRQYTDWITSTAWDAYCVAPDLDVALAWAEGLRRNVDGWLATYDTDEDGLLLVDSHWWTGMEWQPSFFYFKDFDKDRQDQHLERVDLTAYVYGNAANLAKLLEALGDNEGAGRYRRIAWTIRKALLDVMWDADAGYFYSVEPNTHEKAMVKEVIGVYPFYFGMIPTDSACVAAWGPVLDKDELWTAWPVASASQQCPAYSQDVTFHGKHVGGCMWNGPTWPHANSLVLSAMAATLRDFADPLPLTPDYFQALLTSYTVAQFRDQDVQFPWTGEYYNGDTAAWRTSQRDYNHSTYVDIVIADLAGLRPRPDDILEVQPMLSDLLPWFVVDGVRYHNHDLTIAWNATGAGTDSPDGLEGFRIYVDGKLVHHTGAKPDEPLRIGLDMKDAFRPVPIDGPGSF